VSFLFATAGTFGTGTAPEFLNFAQTRVLRAGAI